MAFEHLLNQEQILLRDVIPRAKVLFKSYKQFSSIPQTAAPFSLLKRNADGMTVRNCDVLHVGETRTVI